jgi:predicted NUDIX family NTP pyrophosphohydrolase
MTAPESAGLLLYRKERGVIEVLLVLPGGPFWARKDSGSWTIPKGEVDPGEDRLAAARREFREETGFAPAGAPVPLTPVKQRGGKVVHAWAVAGDWDPSRISSNTFTLEWPPKSGRLSQFPEVDRAEWFELAEARRKILLGLVPLLDQLAARESA